MNHTSNIIARLDTTTISQLTHEINGISDSAWSNHFEGQYAVNGALRHGRTCWLRRVNRHLGIELDVMDNYPVSKNIISNLAKNSQYGRAYWHKLLPGQVIDKHDDTNLGFSEKVLHRYQIYLDIPANAEIIIDNGRKMTKDLENSILDFNMFLSHSYNNKGSTALTFMVVDIMFPDITVSY